MEKKPCLLTTYVAGEKYQAFIPMLIFSCKKAYPEYDIMLFLYEELQQSIRDILNKVGLNDKVIIREKAFMNECTKMTGLKAMSLRWVLWDDLFKNYQYLYVIDIDMFYIREPQPLHLQHSERMKKTGLPFDNMRRNLFLHKSIKGTIRRIQTAGLKYLSIYLSKRNICEERLSGLHFVEVNDYYTDQNLQIIEDYKRRICKRFFIPEILTSDNEVMLANMIKEMGYDISSLGVQTDAVSSLPFDNIHRSEFRPHHGFHLGIFREGIPENNAILDSNTYNYYKEQYLKIIKEDDFKKLYNNLPELSKLYVNRLHSYYHINNRDE